MGNPAGHECELVYDTSLGWCMGTAATSHSILFFRRGSKCGSRPREIGVEKKTRTHSEDAGPEVQKLSMEVVPALPAEQELACRVKDWRAEIIKSSPPGGGGEFKVMMLGGADVTGGMEDEDGATSEGQVPSLPPSLPQSMPGGALMAPLAGGLVGPQRAEVPMNWNRARGILFQPAPIVQEVGEGTPLAIPHLSAESPRPLNTLDLATFTHAWRVYWETHFGRLFEQTQSHARVYSWIMDEIQRLSNRVAATEGGAQVALQSAELARQRVAGSESYKDQVMQFIGQLMNQGGAVGAEVEQRLATQLHELVGQLSQEAQMAAAQARQVGEQLSSWQASVAHDILELRAALQGLEDRIVPTFQAWWQQYYCSHMQPHFQGLEQSLKEQLNAGQRELNGQMHRRDRHWSSNLASVKAEVLQAMEAKFSEYLLQPSQGQGLTDEDRSLQGSLVREVQGLRAEVASLRQQPATAVNADRHQWDSLMSELSDKVDSFRGELDGLKFNPLLMFGGSRLEQVEEGVREARAGLADVSMRARSYAPQASLPSPSSSGSLAYSSVPPRLFTPVEARPVPLTPSLGQWAGTGGDTQGDRSSPPAQPARESPVPGLSQGGLVPRGPAPAPAVVGPDLSGFIVTPEGKYLVPGFDSDEQHWFDALIDSDIVVEPKYKGPSVKVPGGLTRQNFPTGGGGNASYRRSHFLETSSAWGGSPSGRGCSSGSGSHGPCIWRRVWPPAHQQVPGTEIQWA